MAALHIHPRPGLAIDQNDIAEELRQMRRGRRVRVKHRVGRGIEQFTIDQKLAVLDQQGHFVRELRQDRCQRGLVVITDEIVAGQAHIDVLAGNAEGVVVVPEVARFLRVVVSVGHAEQAPLEIGLTIGYGRTGRRVEGAIDIRGAPGIGQAIAQILAFAAVQVGNQRYRK